jgi:hypothetical protein
MRPFLDACLTALLDIGDTHIGMLTVPGAAGDPPRVSSLPFTGLVQFALVSIKTEVIKPKNLYPKRKKAQHIRTA